MEKQYLTGQVKEINTESRTLTAYASTADVDRDGEVILTSAWEQSLDTYRNNAVLLWAHDYRIPPVGKVTDIGVDGKGLRFTTEFAKTEFADEVWQLYRDEFLNAFSVGFIPEKWTDTDADADEKAAARFYTEVSLLEISAVPVPANAHSLVERGVPVLAFKSVDDFANVPKDDENAETLSQLPPEPESAPTEPKNAVDDTVTAPDELSPELTNESDVEPTTDPTDADNANDDAEPSTEEDALLERLAEFLTEIGAALTEE